MVYVYFRIHHYCIERQPDGSVMIPDGRKFPGPVELIRHHSQYLDGFLTKPKIPCARPNGTVPMAWPGVTMLELEQILLEEAENQKLNKVCYVPLTILCIYLCFLIDIQRYR